MFVEGDGRSPWARRRRDLAAIYADDLGGASQLTGFQLGLVNTCATLRVELEQLEGQLSMGRPVDLDGYARVAGHFRRICETLGLQRRARNVTPGLPDYLTARHAPETAEGASDDEGEP
jgi:hypothetical protein